ncbi:MAG TPA: SDR family NAD(P)-dependent oxidoreductase, partial [Spirochaetia bacterium]|nr:SDR family NAD(P)-dependent oxidoreductase [Spirochaetia bacterium]
MAETTAPNRHNRSSVGATDPVETSKPILERFRLDGKVALVTGGGQGIGRAYAHALGEAGAAVAIVDISPDLAKSTSEELTSKGIDSIGVVADVTDRLQISAMIDSIIKKWGKLTIGVNNAGIGQWVPAEEITPEVWSKIIRLNLDAVLYCAQAEAEVMIRGGYGKIINTASMSGHIVNTPQPQTPYNVSKAGVLHLTKSLAAEWAGRGVRVNSISPGYTRTNLVEQLISTPEGKAIFEKWIPMIPMNRMAEVTDLQGALL